MLTGTVHVIYVPGLLVVVPMAVLHDAVLVLGRDEAGDHQILELDLLSQRSVIVQHALVRQAGWSQPRMCKCQDQVAHMKSWCCCGLLTGNTRDSLAPSAALM